MDENAIIPERIDNAWILEVAANSTPVFGYNTIRLELCVQKNDKADKETIKAACIKAIYDYFALIREGSSIK